MWHRHKVVILPFSRQCMVVLHLAFLKCTTIHKNSIDLQQKTLSQRHYVHISVSHLTVFTDRAALLRLIDRIDTLRHGTISHHTVHLIIWFTATPLTRRGLEEGEREEREGMLLASQGTALKHYSCVFKCVLC